MKFMADGGIVGADGMTEAQRAKRNAALSSLGMSTATAPVQPAQAAPLPQAPVQQPPVQAQDRPRGIIGIVGGRQQQIDKAAGYAKGGLIRDAAEYWADDNARFDNSNPSFAGRVIRAVNPLTGFGSAMGAMHTAAGNGDIPGMAMAGISAIPAFGVMRITPASSALKAAAVPSAGRTAGAVSGGAVLNAIADEYQANKPSGYANGGKIEGPGTPTSDSIPAKVKETGEEIRVSNGERIVSAEQGALLEALARKSGFDSLDAMLEAGTGKPVGPTIKGGKRAAADGMSPEEKEWRLKTGNLMSEYPGKPSEYNAEASRMLPPVFPDGFGAKVNPDAPPVGLDKVVSGIAGMFSDAARASNTAETKSYEQLRAERAGTQQQASSATGAQQTNPLVSGIQNTSPFVVAKERFPISVEGGQFITGSKPGEMPSSAQGGFTQDGKSYTVNPTSQTGISRVTAPGTNPLITNIDPEKAVEMMNRFGHMRMNPIDAEHQMPGMKPIIASVGQDAAAGQMAGTNSGQVRIGDGGFNLAGQNDRMAKSLGYAGTDDFNKQWNDRAEAGRGGGVTLVEAAPGKTRAELDNEEKTLRWMAEDILRRGGRGSAAAAAQIMGNISAERIARTNAEAARYGHDVARYGHDVAARRAVGHDDTLRGIEAMRVAGNPLDQQSKQLELKKQGIISGLFDKANSGDQEALAKYNALVNGSKEPNYSNRYITLPNRKTYNAMGQITGEEPGGVFDAKTGQLANFGKQGTGVNIEEANKIKAAVASGAMKREDAIKKLQAMGLQ